MEAGAALPGDAVRAFLFGIGAIAITGSHAALFPGKPDGVISIDLTAVFFSDGSVGLDQARISRLADLDQRRMPAGAAAAASARIGDARSIYQDGVLSHVNQAAGRGARAGMAVKALSRVSPNASR